MIKNFNEWNAALDGERMNEYFALAARLAEAVSALEEYGKHQQGCPVIFTESLCTCGLTAARARAADSAPVVAPDPAARPPADIGELLCNLAQMLDHVRSEWGPAWSAWDQMQREAITRFQSEASVSAPAVLDPDEIVNAQHDETGRMWQGKRRNIPRRFYEVATSTVEPKP